MTYLLTYLLSTAFGHAVWEPTLPKAFPQIQNCHYTPGVHACLYVSFAHHLHNTQHTSSVIVVHQEEQILVCYNSLKIPAVCNTFGKNIMQPCSRRSHALANSLLLVKAWCSRTLLCIGPDQCSLSTFFWQQHCEKSQIWISQSDANQLLPSYIHHPSKNKAPYSRPTSISCFHRTLFEGLNTPSSDFAMLKIFGPELGWVVLRFSPEYGMGTKCNNQEIVRHDVRQTRITLKLAKFYAHFD